MAELLKPAEETELCTLWESRAQLSKPQWDRLWHLVYQALSRCNPSVLRSLPDTKQDYITDFFLSKVMREQYSGAKLESAAALCTFFQRYLIQVQRQQIRRAEHSVDSAEELDELVLNHTQETSIAANIDCGCRRPEHTNEWRVMLEAAFAFYVTLEKEDKIYLSLHTCDPDAEPLSKIADRYRIASYHYRAGRLGITRKKGELPSDYETTRIGQWMAEKLGINTNPYILADVLRAFKALCEAAITLRDTLPLSADHA
jgi:hypothetical protein